MASKRLISDHFKLQKRKPFSNLPLISPWKTRAPFFKPNSKERKIPGQNIFYQTPIKNKSPKITIVTDVNNIQCKKPLQIKPTAVPPISNGSTSHSQFQYFMRLMQLFPLIHPAYIHSVLNHCNNNFLKTIDTLLRARPARLSAPIRKFGPAVHYFHKIPSPRFVPRPIMKLNGFNGMRNMNLSLCRNYNLRMQFPPVFPKNNVKNLQFDNLQKFDNVPVVKIEAKDPST